VTDSASDLEPDEAAQLGLTVVPLYVSFGDREYRAGVDLSSSDFWNELTAPGAPFPKTAAAPPGAFREVFERHFASGADDVIYVGVGSRLSGTIASAKVARDGLPSDRQRRVHIVDSQSASMGVTVLARMAVELAATGKSADGIVRELERRRPDIALFVVLETLDYLKRGGRISPARAAIGNVLSVKPIITIVDGIVDTADRPRTRSKARARLLELLSEREVEQVCLLHAQAQGMDEFGDELARATGFPREKMTSHLIGASVGPHVGPGAYGAIILRRTSSTGVKPTPDGRKAVRRALLSSVADPT
jgi:DegV family protein with EDD domain